jgi:hypothetical protein
MQTIKTNFARVSSKAPPFPPKISTHIVSRMVVNIVDVGVSTVCSPHSFGPLQPWLADFPDPELEANSGLDEALGDRDQQQDRYITFEPRSLKSRKELALFAIFDGQYVTTSGSVVLLHYLLVQPLT